MTEVQESYKLILEQAEKFGGTAPMGYTTSFSWRTDPRHVLFTMARYKFCAKMLFGKQHVLDVGCGDAFFMPILLQEVQKMTVVDIHQRVLEDNVKLYQKEYGARVDYLRHDLCQHPLKQKFDAVVSIDVIEHIPANLEEVFLTNLTQSLRPDGVCIMGTPNIESDKYASLLSKMDHINLKSGKSFRELLLAKFANVFLFSMNDEVVHTGYLPMAHYYMAVATGLI